VCPTTRQEVDSGVESEISTLLRIRDQTMRALCPACGKWHEWPVRDAFLSKAA
jgi:tetrahydromethanopterin S-methyltransferase subunit B